MSSTIPDRGATASGRPGLFRPTVSRDGEGRAPRRGSVVPVLPAPLYVLAGVAGFALGLLPWLVTGLRLPLQNLWAVEVLPEQMPRVLLPFSQYALTLILGLVVSGAAAVGLVARLGRGGRPRVALLAGVGWFVAAVFAAGQTGETVSRGLADDPRADLYLTALLATTGVAIVLGMVVLALIALASPAGASIGGAFGALAAGVWLDALVVPFGSIGSDWQTTLLGGARWVPAVLVGAVLAWCGVHGVGRVVAWVVDLLLLWVVPAGLTAVSYATGSRVLLGQPAEAVAAGLQVFAAALTPAGVSWQLVVVALVVGLAGLLLRRLRGSSSRAAH
ncbi:hypothetical protein GC722_02975 [Auraticoccus sp. F435]|uniref:Uncharacterized protein n=1 Tax=Auraticoccus cholistanensis TaxID=2656650 RepID=A0A6A9UTD0_9ACTN|nr:hypothetical protein [Auraticoccus cholistanensis]MVA74995.1 hypothetical protein [Auraticoccus cholistanensis]